MKKLFFTLIAVFCISISVMNAQTYVGAVNSSYPFPIGIPGCFTNSGHSCVIVGTKDNGNIAVFDNDFSTCLLNLNAFCAGDDFYSVTCEYADLSAGGCITDAGMYIMFTQNLFNSDDNFEYVENLPTCWNIKSTNETIVNTIYPDEGYRASNSMLVKIDNMFYLLLSERNQSNSQEKTLIYRIDREQGLSKVETDLSISAFPSIANRGQQITVELGEGNNAKEVIVINSLGQVIKRVPVQDGQKQISIQANELNSGLNVVNTRNQKGQGSCKIIVQ